MMYRAFHDPEQLLTPEDRERRYYAKMLTEMDKSITLKNGY